MYHIGDFLRYWFHRGPKTVFWCGSDILHIKATSILWAGKHVCENEVEQEALDKWGIHAEIHPMIFDDPEKYKVTYKQSDTPTVWMTYHLGREEEYGLYRFLSVAASVPELRFKFFNGDTKTRDFDKETENYQATIRFNEHDGFSENLSKAVLRGQYAFSAIHYPYIEDITEDDKLIKDLKELKNKIQPNPGSDFWREHLSKRVEI